MQFQQFGRGIFAGLAVLGLTACSSSAATPETTVAAANKAVPVTAAPTTIVTAAARVPPTTATTAKPKPTTTTQPQPRSVTSTNFGPFLHTEGLVLNYPTGSVERVGLHESNRAGARTLGTLPAAGEVIDLPSRERKTNARTAADILSDPDGEVRAPISGVVKRGGTYTLYCKYTDSYLVIAPDGRPEWEVKLLHISGLTVQAGQRVEAGQTVVAAHPTRLPFKSQVEDYSTAPVWPHVHVEVVDPSIKNPPGVGGKGCS